MAAQSFFAFATEAGVDCVMPVDLNQIELNILSERNGEVKVMLYTNEKSTPIHSILNRGLPITDSSGENQFQFSETLASWWTALACFEGKVINRPSQSGFLPQMDLLSLVTPQIKLTATYVSSNNLIELQRPQINLHLLRNRELIQMTNDLRNVQLNQQEVYFITGFDPTRTLHILRAGESIINLSNYSGQISSSLNKQLVPLIECLTEKSALLSLVVLERTEQELCLIHATPFPTLNHYKHLSHKVNHSLLEYLIS